MRGNGPGHLRRAAGQGEPVPAPRTRPRGDRPLRHQLSHWLLCPRGH